jgi:hypothetical protein
LYIDKLPTNRQYLSMALEAPTDETRRTWQEVAKERGISLRILGELIGKTHSTMLAYSMGRRVPPQDVMWRIKRALGEDVR